MAEIPADAPRSEDGHYWWDGSQWQLVAAAQGGAQGQAQGGQQAAAAPAQHMTDELFANMLQAAESDVQEA
ncbi:MAG TPA: hypothetical protein VH333_23105 [Pseudonocardiaceae bacterium]|jgi:hypothetical protein|nr:hypothetical protein [Pseudonocardiaceae bacterium]